MAHQFLVVEDDVTIVSFIESVLEAEGYEVLTAHSVAEADAQLAARPDASDFCLVIDVVLENENGIEYAQDLLKRHPDFRVLFISGFTDDVVVVEPEYAKRTAFLPKPFGRDDLLAALGQVCR